MSALRQAVKNNWPRDADGNLIDFSRYQQTVNNIRRLELSFLPTGPGSDFKLQPSHAIFDCYRSKYDEVRCPLLTMIFQRANYHCHRVGYELIPAAFSATLTETAAKELIHASMKEGVTASAKAFGIIKQLIDTVAPGTHFLTVFDETNEGTDIHGYLIISPEKVAELENACIDSKSFAPQCNNKQHVETTYTSHDTAEGVISRSLKTIDISWSSNLALLADPVTGVLNVQLCIRMADLLNQQYRLEYYRQQATGKIPRQYAGYKLAGQSRYGTAGREEKAQLINGFPYELAPDHSGGLVLKKTLSEAYYNWRRNAPPGTLIPAHLDYLGPETFQMPDRAAARNPAYRRTL